MAHNYSFVEDARRYWYPRLHRLARWFGAYSVTDLTKAQYVCSLNMSKYDAEKWLLHDMEFERNLVAAYKTHRGDGRKSVGSYRLTYEPSRDHYDKPYVDKGKQLHVTFMESNRVGDGIDVYAHYEWNWEHSPIKHLRAVGMSAKEGVKRMMALIRKESYLKENEDYLLIPK